MSALSVPKCLLSTDHDCVIKRYEFCEKFQAEKIKLEESLLDNDAKAAIYGVGLIILSVLAATFVAYSSIPILFSAVIISTICVIGLAVAIGVMCEFGRRSRQDGDKLANLNISLEMTLKEEEIKRNAAYQQNLDAQTLIDNVVDQNLFNSHLSHRWGDDRKRPTSNNDNIWLRIINNENVSTGKGVNHFRNIYQEECEKLSESASYNRIKAAVYGLGIFCLAVLGSALIACTGAEIAFVAVGIVAVCTMGTITAFCVIHRYNMRNVRERETTNYIHIILIEKLRSEHFLKLRLDQQQAQQQQQQPAADVAVEAQA